MPLIHYRTFRVRHHECDTYGYARYSSYLNYMQEAAFDASAAAGYDLARYEEMGRHWLVRETDVEYLHPRPLRYNDMVQVKTWVIDFRRVRSRRAYELSLVETAEVVVQASTDWVLLDSITGRPVSIPAEMMSAFFPEGAPEQAPPRSRFPSLPPPPADAFRTGRRVAWSDIDTAGIVNNAVYLAYLEDGDEQAAAACGWPPARLQAEGISLAPRRHQIEYRQPALLGDELELTTWLSRVAPAEVVRHYAITRSSDNSLLVRARAGWEAIEVETGRPIPIPRAFLGELISESGGD
jgi:acyl-CoA thioester hydrolase